MKKVFVGGSRRISRLNADICRRLDQMIERNLDVFVGDANGADKAIQAYFRERQYPRVVVFCSAGECRNNLAAWPVQPVTPPHKEKDFEFFTAKDAEMARKADVGFMLWDGKSSGTIVNVARLIAAGKPAVVYVAPKKNFLTLRKTSDLQELLSACPREIQHRIDRYIAKHAEEYEQPSIFATESNDRGQPTAEKGGG